MIKTSSIHNLFDSFKEESFGVTIGNFDGVHIGHQELIKNFVSYCRANNLKSVVVSFSPHPREILLGHRGFLLMDEKDKNEQLEKLGVDAIITYKFTRDLSNTKPNDFIEKFLAFGGRTKYLHVGYDFNFGENRKGNFETLKKYFEKNKTKLSQEIPFKINEEIVSSSAVREKLKNGDMQGVFLLLNRYFYHEGIVEKGDKRGRELGFPTANIFASDRYSLPSNGVYVTLTNYNGVNYRSITNVGTKPTFTDSAGINVENHLFDFSKEIYGENIKVYFIKKIRAEKKFNSANDLIEQIRQDIDTCQNWFINNQNFPLK